MATTCIGLISWNDLPLSNVAPSWLALCKKYGDIIYFNVLGQPIITLNTVHHALELLEKKSANLSNRPDSVMLKLLGLDDYFVLMPYGRKWREHRRAFHQTFGPESVGQWEFTQLKSARRLLYRLLESPKDFVVHLNIAFTETLMRVAYGIELSGDEGDREYYQMADRVAAIAEPLLRPSAHVIEAFPLLRRLPSWLPGMGVKRDAEEKKNEVRAITSKLYTLSTTATDKGAIRDSMVTRILAGVDTKNARESDVREVCEYVTAASFIAGVETSHAAMEAFCLAMAMHTEIQTKAQRELDAVVGPDRLPEFSDLDSLPYMRAIIKETQRWHIISPLGVPHTAMADDEYMGYHIPAGTIINQNLWAMSRDPGAYPNPEAFIPERFLPAGDKPPAKDPAEYVFGFGRRICPGRHFAEGSLFIYCASILHVFDIRPPLDEHGVPVKLTYRAKDEMISRVQGYEYLIEVRGLRAERLVGEASSS